MHKASSFQLGDLVKVRQRRGAAWHPRQGVLPPAPGDQFHYGVVESIRIDNVDQWWNTYFVFVDGKSRWVAEIDMTKIDAASVQPVT